MVLHLFPLVWIWLKCGNYPSLLATDPRLSGFIFQPLIFPDFARPTGKALSIRGIFMNKSPFNFRTQHTNSAGAIDPML
jgi:hypothetical protein